MDLETILIEDIEKSVRDMFSKNLSLSAETTESDVINLDHRNLSCFITFKGKLTGAIEIFSSEFSATSIAATMLGLGGDDEAMSTVDTKDTIGEVLNMVLGGCKNRLEDSGYTFEMGVPEFSSDGPVKEEEDRKVFVQNFVCEDIKFQIRFHYKIVENAEQEAPAEPEMDATAMLLAAMGQAPAPAAEETSVDSSNEDQNSSDSNGLADKSFLVIHEDAIERKDIEEVLKEAQVTNIALAADKAEGLTKASAEKPDFIILDGFLTGSSGAELCTELKNVDGLSTKTVMLVDAEDSFIKKMGEKAGANGFYVNIKGYSGLVDQIKSIA